MRLSTQEELNRMSPEEKEYTLAKMDYDMLSQANAYGLTAIESAKLDMRYQKSQDRYFKARRLLSEQSN